MQCHQGTPVHFLNNVHALSMFFIKGCWDWANSIQSHQVLEQRRMATKLITVASILVCHMAAAIKVSWVLNMICKLYLVKNRKIVNNSKITDTRDKKHIFGNLRMLEIFGCGISSLLLIFLPMSCINITLLKKSAKSLFYFQIFSPK